MQSRKLTNEWIKSEWNGLKVEGRVVINDYEGDSSIPRGINYLDPYVEDICVYTPEDEDIAEFISEEGLDDIRDMLIKEATED